jgi:hypothetical protein
MRSTAHPVGTSGSKRQLRSLEETPNNLVLDEGEQIGPLHFVPNPN